MTDLWGFEPYLALIVHAYFMMQFDWYDQCKKESFVYMCLNMRLFNCYRSSIFTNKRKMIFLGLIVNILDYM